MEWFCFFTCYWNWFNDKSHRPEPETGRQQRIRRLINPQLRHRSGGLGFGALLGVSVKISVLRQVRAQVIPALACESKRRSLCLA